MVFIRPALRAAGRRRRGTVATRRGSCRTRLRRRGWAGSTGAAARWSTPATSIRRVPRAGAVRAAGRGSLGRHHAVRVREAAHEVERVVLGLAQHGEDAVLDDAPSHLRERARVAGTREPCTAGAACYVNG